MQKKEVTYWQVKGIADKIKIAGDRPTVMAVYDVLGGIVSKQLIAKYLREWRQEQAAGDDAVASTEQALSMQQIRDQYEKRAEELKRSLSLVRATLESTADGILLTNNQGQLVDFNQKFMELSRLPTNVLETGKEQAGIKYLFDQLEDPRELYELMMRVSANPNEQGDMGEVRFKDGRIYERYTLPHRLGHEIVGRVWSFRDVTEQRKQEETLRLRERAIEASTQGVIITDDSPEQKILYVNSAFEKISGYSKKEALNRELHFFNLGKENEPMLESLKLAHKENCKAQAILRSVRKNGDIYWNEMFLAPVPDTKGKISHFVAIVTDVTERKAMEEQLVHQATHDLLTDLPNRLLLQDRISQATLYARRAGMLAGVFFLDLDRFKLVNDSLGHKMGDLLLRAVALRLSQCIRDTDTLARLGGDEFVIILSPLRHEEESIVVAQNIMKAFRKPFQIEERELNITASMGIAHYPMNGEDAETLIRNADTAMYYAKDLGRQNFQFFTGEMNRRVSQRLTMENNLHRALEKNEFSLCYQPVVNLKSNQVTGVEALIRWQHPQNGPISPSEFIPMAEETGLIIPIGEWVLTTACEQNVKWQAKKLPELTVSVNVSGRQLREDNFVKKVKRILRKTRMAPRYLVLEITETMLMDHELETIDKLNELKHMGITLAIDDFGTGYSSLSYLKKLPIDKLKIDQAFVRNISTDPDDAAITLAIIAMSKSLGLKVVAEGAETQQVVEYLRHHKCDEVQGYFFSKPIDAESCERLVRENYGLLKEL